MKKFVTITTLFMAFMLSFSLFACSQEQTAEPPTSSSSESSVDDGGEETEFYDDGGKYDAIIDKAEYSWSDSEGLLDGAFSDGVTEKSYASFSSSMLTDGRVVGRYTGAAVSPQMSVLSGAELLGDGSIVETIRTGVKGSHDDDKVMDGLADRNFLKIESEGYKTLQLNVKPQCTLSEFEEADFLSFKMCFYRENTKAEETVYFKNRPLLRMFANTWYEIKVPLSLWMDTGDKSNYEDKAALYGSLNGDVVSGDKSKGQFLYVVGTKNDGSTENDFVAYISDIKLGVDEVEEALGRNLVSLTQTANFNYTTCLTNTWVYWANTEKVRREDESEVNKQIIQYSYENNDGLNIAVNPVKKLEQIQQYDYVYVTMYIETDNPFPIEVGINGSFQNSKKATNVLISGMSQNSILVSANKWITYKIPIKGVLERFYGRLQLNRIYTVANVPYVYYQNAMPLFFINGEYIRSVNSEAKTETYGMNVYVSRIFLVKE